MHYSVLFSIFFLGNYETDWFPWGALFKCVICIYVLFHNETRECLLEWCMFWKVQILSQMKAVWIMCVESAFITEEWSYHCGLWVVLLAVTKRKSVNFIKSLFCALIH